MSGPTYVLAPAAAADILEIHEFIANDDPAAADRVIDRIVDGMAALARRPGIGHVRNDLARESLRFWRVYSYLIVYRPDKKPLEVVRVLSGHRDVQALLAGE